MRRSVYFEGLQWWHAPLILIGRVLKWNMSVFDGDLRLRQRRFPHFAEQRGWVRRIVAHHLPMGDTHSRAIEAAEKIINTMSGHPAIRAIAKLYDDHEILLVYKKVLAQELAKVFSIHHFLLHQEATIEGAGSVLFFGASYHAAIKLLRAHQIALQDMDSLRVVGGTRTYTYLYGIGVSVSFLALSVWVIVLLASASLQKKKSNASRKFNISISLSSAFHTKFEGSRSFRFLVDDVSICRKSAIFLMEIPPPHGFMARHQADGFNFTVVPGYLEILSLLKYPPQVVSLKRVLLAMLRLVGCGWRSSFLASATASSIMEYIKWSTVLSHVYFDNYVYSNKEGMTQIAANVFFRKHGIRSHCYSMFIGGAYQMEGNETNFDARNVHWSFLNCDVYALNNNAMAESMRKQYQSVRHYTVIGNIFSEMIVKLDTKVCRSKLLGEWREGTRIITVFDTSYMDMPEIYSNYDECIAFLKDIICLAENRSDDFFLFKPSKNDDYFINPKTPWSSAEKGHEVVAL